MTNVVGVWGGYVTTRIVTGQTSTATSTRGSANAPALIVTTAAAVAAAAVHRHPRKKMRALG